jgi:glycosyltransferase involved in cell wall biosynthesis
MDVQEFTEKISLLIKDDSLYSSMSKQAKMNAELISSKNCALRLARCYQELLGCEINNLTKPNQSTGRNR